MKKVIALLLVSVLALNLVACGNKEESVTETSKTTVAKTTSETPAKKEDVTIRFYNYELSEAAKADWWQKTITNFEKENPNVKIETVTVDYNSMIQTFTNDLASGLSVDLINGEVNWVPALVDGGFIQEPKNVIDADFYNNYYDYVLNQFQYDGGIYGVPQYYTDSLIFVNKDLVEAAGLNLADFPTTLDGLKEWIETLSKFYKNNDSISTIFGLTTAEVPATGANINAIYTAFGGTLINDDGTLADMTAEPNKTAMTETLDFYKYLIGNGYTQENLKLKDYRASFGAGNVCMYVDSSWGFAQIGEVDAKAKDFTVSASLPTKMGTNGKGSTLVEAHCYLIGADLSDAQKVAVNDFIKYSTSTANMEDFVNNVGLAFVAHKDMADCKVSPILEGASKGVSNVKVQPQLSAIVSVQKQLATTVLNYTINGMSIDDAIKDYMEQAQYYIDQ